MKLVLDTPAVNFKFSVEKAAQMLNAIRGTHSEMEVSLIQHEGICYFSRYRPMPHCPSSATIKLIQGLFEQHRDLSFFILRERIFTTEVVTAGIKGTVRLTAKRITRLSPSEGLMPTKIKLVEIGNIEGTIYTCSMNLTKLQIPEWLRTPKEAMDWVDELAAGIPRASALHDQNRAVAAVITSAEGKVLSHATNSAFQNKTLHAEVCAAQIYYLNSQKGLPKGSKIFVSLKPCRMCAGILFDMALEPTSLQIYYRRMDNGPLAQQTALENQLIYFPKP